jgi:hypothetical protein
LTGHANLPAGTASFNQSLNIVFGNDKIAHPAVMVGCFSILIDDPVLEKVDLISVCTAIERHIIDPMVLMTSAFFIDDLC